MPYISNVTVFDVLRAGGQLEDDGHRAELVTVNGNRLGMMNPYSFQKLKDGNDVILTFAGTGGAVYKLNKGGNARCPRKSR